MSMRNIIFYEYNETIITPLALIVTLINGFIILYIEKRYLIIPLIINIIFIPYMQRIVVAGLDFDMLRIVILFSFIRIFITKKEFNDIKFNKIDKIFFIWIIVSMIIYVLRVRTFKSFVNRAGISFNAFGIYLVIRISINKIEDIAVIFKTLIILSFPIMIAMIIELKTSKNLFYVFGGVPEFTYIREGKLRCQASFPHPILAGTFGGLLLSFTWGLWVYNKKTNLFYILGFLSSIIITFTASSSGAIMTFGSGAIGAFLWIFRKKITFIRRSFYLSLVVLDMFMTGPIWALLNKVAIVSGSTANHRYRLVDAFMRRIPEWGVLGVNTSAHWGWGLQDVTNMYVRVGIDSGFITLFFFIYIIVICFKSLGKNLKSENFTKEQYCILWALGVNLFSHIISFIGVSYFGNMMFFYYLTIGFISTFYQKNLINPDNVSKINT